MMKHPYRKLCLLMPVLAALGLACRTASYTVGETYHGFTLKEKRFVSEVNAECYLFEHEQSGARLLKFANDDANKTFCVGFKTTPETDCGTAHIMEHSVLNGSKHFPVKSPFDVLSKGSLNTFLNAMTGSDLTVYPVASMNDKDFFNLMHVYLDAVFNPLIYDDPRIFKQEGWHYEMTDKSGPLVYKGVVFNEMKGAYSSPMRELGFLVDRNLFPDNTYGKASGGYPSAIPQLTYEQFLDFHRKYYHPSNSYIFLYGDGDMDRELAFIDTAYLAKYERSDDIAKIVPQAPFRKMKKVKGYYSVPEGADTRNQTYLRLSMVVGEGRDQELSMALDLLTDALVNHETGPVRLALQKAGIGRDVSGGVSSQKQNVLQITVQNADPGDMDRFYTIVMDEFAKAADTGIDKETIRGILNRTEFRLREGNDAQKGMTSVFQAVSGWWYADDPFLSLEWEGPLAHVKAALDTTLLEEVIKTEILGNQHAVLAAMMPKANLVAEKAAEEAKELAAYYATLSDADKEALVKETEELMEYQKREDTPEALATIPMLELSDISRSVDWYTAAEKQAGGLDEIYFDTFANGVVYSKLLFDVRVLPREMIPWAALLSEVLTSINTENYTFGELDNALNIHTGGFTTFLTTYLPGQDSEKMMPKFVVSSKAMAPKVEKMFELTDEIMHKTVYTDKDRLRTVLARYQARLDARLKADGLTPAATRLLSYFTNQGMFNELTRGLEYYWFVTGLVDDFDIRADEIIASLTAAADILFRKDNCLVNVTCDGKDLAGYDSALARFAETLSPAPAEQQQWTFDLEIKNEGLLTSSKVQYVLKGYDFRKLGYDWDGSIRVLNQVLSTDWLHNQIRVIGGAYGGFCQFMKSGPAIFASYRDPNLSKTLENFDGSPGFIASFDPDEEVMTRYIIGTISGMDQPLTAADRGNVALTRWLEKATKAELQAERNAVLTTTPGKLREMQQFLSDILGRNALCVYGNENTIKSEKELFKNLISLDR
ncbi:insulinase family protein [bacterium]|nr:insulinase family protein [bacterium]